MPITVNEVVVNTSVNETASNNTSADNKGGGGMSTKEKELLIEECLRRVAEMLEDRHQR
jgi:hypothetical protein